METFLQSVEREPKSTDVSAEFLAAEDSIDFMRVLRERRNDPVLSITVDWPSEEGAGVYRAQKLKAFLDSLPANSSQKRFATIRMTRAKYDEVREVCIANEISSGVKVEIID